MDYCVVTFASSGGAITAQKVLDGQVPSLIMPVLRELSAGCGIALRLAPEMLSRAAEVLEGSSLRREEYAFYAVTGSGPSLQVRPLSGEGVCHG